jgi:phospholipid transport system substrate-binding protein
MMRRFFVSLITMLVLTLSATMAWAGPATDAVKSKQNELFKLLEAENNDANKKKIAAIFDEMLDYDALAKASMGDQWSNLKAEEKKEFTGLLKQLVTRAYETNLRSVLPFNIAYQAEEKKSDGVLVKTKATHKTDKRADPVHVDFMVVDKGGGKYKVVDIVTEDISLVDSYRSQFVKIYKDKGYFGLTQKMKDKIAKGK